MATLTISPPSTSVTLNALPNFLPPRSLLPLRNGGRSVLVGGESRLTVGRVQVAEFSTSFFDNDDAGDMDLDELDDEDEEDDIFAEAHDPEKETPPCPPGLRKYESVVVLRPDMSEDERLALVQKYEELLVAGGGMYVEVYNKGVFPLDYGIKKKNRDGETNTYWDGIYLMFTYSTKPASIEVLESTLLRDDNVIRLMTLEESKKSKARSKKQMEKNRIWQIERARRKLAAADS